MDYGLLLCLFVTSYANARAREWLLCPTRSVFHASTNASILIILTIEIQIQCYKKRLSQTSFRTSQFDLTHRFFKITSSNSVSFCCGRRRSRHLCSGEARTVPPLTHGGPNTVSKRNCRWCYLSRAATHDKSQENSDRMS